MKFLRTLLYAATAIAALIVLRFLFHEVTSAAWESSALKKLMVPGADRLLRLFNNPLGLIVIALFLLLASVFLTMVYRMAAASVARRLARLRLLIEGVGDHGGTLLALQAVDSICSNEPLVANEWRVYRRTFVQSEKSPERVYLTYRPVEFLSAAVMERKVPGRVFMAGAPGYFLAMGVILALFGLFAGVWFAARGIPSDPNAGRIVLTQVFSASTFALMAVIAGIASAALLSFGNRACSAKVANQADMLCLSIEDFFPAERSALDLSELDQQGKSPDRMTLRYKARSI